MLKLVCNVLIIGVSVLFSSANFAQKTKSPMNDHPNPYTTINGYFDLPGDRVWGATGAIDISPDGESIWVAERCGTNSCAGSDIDPVVNFDQAGNVIRIDMREDDECGVLWALCPSCGDTYEAEKEGDWNVVCRTNGERSFRALADDFGGESGKAALNGAGKRWSGEAEALFAKGSAGRATYIAEDIREDGRERTYFRFEGEGGQGGGRGRRQKAAPGCRLFVGGLSRDIEEDDVRAMFKKHGKITDFALMRDDAGNLRGFGFITYESKNMADAAIADLDGQKIKGRRIGVRDADAPRDEKPKRARPEGARLYVGNLPFKASEDDLSALFKDHCDKVHVQWATDRSGRKKAFAFVTIQPESKGEEVVGKLNGTDFMGRNIKVDVSKPQNRDRRGNSGGKPGGKSSRELRALAEEEEDAKKKKRRPRKE